MYNLIVSGDGDAWNGEPFDIERTRVGEHTDDAIKREFEPFDEAAINKLLALPTLFAYETAVKRDVRVGRLTRVRSRQGVVRCEYVLEPSVPAIPHSALASSGWELDINKYELNRTHWAIKAVNLSEALIEARLLSPAHARYITGGAAKAERAGHPPELVVRPTVFSVPHVPVEPDLVSVMMPFDAGFAGVWASIQGACAAAELRCLRADNIWQESVLVQDIFNLLMRSSVVIVDFTGKNPNVMYETGIAHTLGRPVVPIAQALDDIPFDLRHHRFLKYLPNDQGFSDMESALTERLRTLVRDH
jgi:hypothetical protein